MQAEEVIQKAQDIKKELESSADTVDKTLRIKLNLLERVANPRNLEEIENASSEGFLYTGKHIENTLDRHEKVNTILLEASEDLRGKIKDVLSNDIEVSLDEIQGLTLEMLRNKLDEFDDYLERAQQYLKMSNEGIKAARSGRYERHLNVEGKAAYGFINEAGNNFVSGFNDDLDEIEKRLKAVGKSLERKMSEPAGTKFTVATVLTFSLIGAGMFFPEAGEESFIQNMIDNVESPLGEVWNPVVLIIALYGAMTILVETVSIALQSTDLTAKDIRRLKRVEQYKG